MPDPEARGPVHIRFCVNNPHTLAERNALIEAGHECVGCLGNCSRCFETRFLEIDGRLVEGENYEDVLKAAELPQTRAHAEEPDPAPSDTGPDAENA